MSRQELVERTVMAIRVHDVAAVRQYLAEGGDPNAADGEGEVLLNTAVLHGTPETLEVLLAAGADPNLPGKNDLGAPALAALTGRHAMLERLMQANATGAAASRATGADPDAAPGDASPEGAVAVAEAVPTVHGDRVEGAENPASPAKPAAAPPALASLNGDGAPQAVSPTEPYASMAGLEINPPARPATGAPAASPAGRAAEGTSQPASPASAPTATPAAPAAGDAPQSWVSGAQRRLGQLGYYKGPITGFAGPLTADAVKRYQAVAGIPQDGIVSADLLRRIGASVEAPGVAPAPPPASLAPAVAPAPAATPAPPATASAAAAQAAGQAPVSSQGLQQVRNALGQEFNSNSRPDALRQHCQANANAWVYDEAIGRSLFCRDVIGSPPR